MRKADRNGTAEDQGRWDKKNMFAVWFIKYVPKNESFRRLYTVWSALTSGAHLNKHREIRVSLEVSPRRKALPRARSRFLQAAESHGAAKVRWRGSGDAGFLRTAAGRERDLEKRWLQSTFSKGKGWELEQEVMRNKLT